MNDGIQLDGIKELQDAMKHLPEQFNRKVLTATARKAAKPLITEARANAPVSAVSRVEWYGQRRKVKPGQMRKSIGSRKTSNREDPGVKVGPSRKNGWWSHFVEFGTAGFTIKKGKNKGRFIPGQRPQPFMMPAYNSVKTEMVQTFNTELKGVLDKFLTKYGKK